jgi:hypothetical protein
MRNPVTKEFCCNNGDCRPVDQKEIGESGDKYTWRGSVFPKNQTQVSPDKNYHVCAYPEHMLGGETKWRIRCLLRPFAGM